MDDLNEVGKAIAAKMAVVNSTIHDDEWKGHKRRNPFYSELTGMLLTLKLMDINYAVEWDEKVNNMTAIVIAGTRFEVSPTR